MEPDPNKPYKNWRGRRLIACEAHDKLQKVIENLGADDGTHLPPSDSEAAPINDDLRNEIANTATNLLRLILLYNDGRVSPSQLNRF